MYGLHFDHHTLSIARDGELLAYEPLAVETAANEPRFGRAALATARGRPDLVSLTHWRELDRDETVRAQRRDRGGGAPARARRSTSASTRSSRCRPISTRAH